MLTTLCALVSISQDVPPPVPREFRGAWVATVDNIDWPSRGNHSTVRQKTELIRILDRAVSLKLNAIVLQVRPAADALYASPYEPWSEYLTGKQGQAPAPYYDPLAFAVEEAHRRGLELHAWLNPYRAKHSTAKSPLAPNHLAKTNPAIVKRYGKQLWMDPGEPAVQRRSLAVIADIVRRYDVDGIHIDDYFYPYPEKGLPFPDGPSYAKYGRGLSKADWRRQNVDNFIQAAYVTIHNLKPWVKFGISPFGIYRTGYPAGITSGIDQPNELYADPLKWLQRGWCDYLTPQLYWPIAQKAQSYPVLLRWWTAQNTQGRHLWPGLFTSRTIPGEVKQRYTPQELVHQIQITRETPGATGHVHFSMKALSLNASGVSDALAGSVYQDDALPPASPWLDKGMPAAPRALPSIPGAVAWEFGDDKVPFWNVLWLRYGDAWQTRVLPGHVTKVDVPTTLPAGPLTFAAVSAVDRCAEQSTITALSLPSGGVDG